MKRRSSGRFGGVMVVAGMTACIPEPVLRVRDGGSDVVVAIADAGADVDVPVPRARPRLLAPMSGAISGSRRPALRWVPGEASAPQRVRVCADRACTRMLHEQAAAPGAASLRMDVELPAGPAFWRVESIVGGESTTSATWEFVVQGRARESVFWYGLPDFDGDGAADLVVGASGNDNSSGLAYVYSRERIISGVPSATLRGGDEPMGLFGFWLESVGDVNGDGFVDLGVSALNESGERGTVRVFHGSTVGLSGVPNAVLRGVMPRIGFGIPVAGVGDVNGDGFADVAVGLSGLATERGACRIYFGGVSGLEESRVYEITTTETSGARFGAPVVALGDLDDDGIDDFLIGASGSNEGDGAAWLFRGARMPTWPSGATRITSPHPGGFGIAASTFGDLDGDGLLEFGVAASRASDGQGRVFTLEGWPSAMPGMTNFVVAPVGDIARGFGSTLSGGHDLNGDGFPDFAVGTSVGRVAIFLGGTSDPATPTVVLYGMDASRPSFGQAVSMFGDADRDGLSELAVGSPRDPDIEPRIFIYRGAIGSSVALPPRYLVNPQGVRTVFGEAIAR